MRRALPFLFTIGLTGVACGAAFESERELADVVVAQHRLAQENKSPIDYESTKLLYEDYLNAFPNGSSSDVFQFYYGEVLYELRDYDAAALAYEGYLDSAGEASAFGPHAAYAAVLISDKKTDSGRSLLTETSALEQTALNAEEQKAISVFNRFADAYSWDDQAVKIKFKVARLFFIHGQFDEAESVFLEVIDGWPREQLARIAAACIVQRHIAEMNVAEAQAWINEFSRSNELTADRSFVRYLQRTSMDLAVNH